MGVKDFLEKKTLYYDKIDFTVIQDSWNLLSRYIKLPYVIHIVGTNGKGSTGRFLAYYLYKKNLKVLHYSSPHILKFNERIWLNGEDIDDITLQKAHSFLQELYPLNILEKLTYFEYATLLALYLSKDVDYLVLEAGLGGEFDATNVVKNDLSLVTTIDLDHQKFLGNSVEEIARTKMRSVDKKMILGYQIHDNVIKVAKEIKQNKNIQLVVLKNFNEYIFNKRFATFLQKNLYLVIACLKQIDIEIDLSLFDELKLRGRCEKIALNITVDVGHNPLAARVLLKEFENKKITLIYNSYADKDYEEVLRILRPIINEIYILDLEDKRVVAKNILENFLTSLNIKLVREFQIDKNKEYLVFGSFLVVEKFLKVYNEK